MYKFNLALFVVAVLVTQRQVTAEEAKDVKVGEITLKTPASWKQSQPTSRLRLAQFAVPAVEGDQENAELAIFSFGGGGGVKANIDRWIGQFDAAGRMAKTTIGDSKNGKYVILEVQGTYKKPVGPPVLGKTELTPNSRMLAVILAVEGKGNYFLKLTGPDKTVAAASDPLRGSFGGDAASEKPLEE